MTAREGVLAPWLEPLRDASAKKHRTRGVKVQLTDPCLTKKPEAICRRNPEKLRFASMDDAMGYRVGANREWLLRTEPYECTCGGVHFRRKDSFR